MGVFCAAALNAMDAVVMNDAEPDGHRLASVLSLRVSERMMAIEARAKCARRDAVGQRLSIDHKSHTFCAGYCLTIRKPPNQSPSSSSSVAIITIPSSPRENFAEARHSTRFSEILRITASS